MAYIITLTLTLNPKNHFQHTKGLHGLTMV